MIDPKNMQYNEIQLLNFYNYFKHKGGHWIDIESKELTHQKHVSWDTPWYHVNPDPERHKCTKLRNLFQAKNFIPSFCLGCWKVCVTPRTLRELFELRDIQLEMVKDNPKCWCKCGIEMRDWTPGKVYGGYFYTNSYDVGIERWKTVRAIVDKRMGEGVNVVLKRYCTEFEIITGDSSKYVRPSNADEVERMYFHLIEDSPAKITQPDWALLETYEKWIRHGWRWGTPEDRRQIEIDHNNGQPLYNIPKTYHPEGK